jgi:hypothetical protein
MASKTGISPVAGKTILQMIEDRLDAAILESRDRDGLDEFTDGFHNGLAMAIAIIRNPYQDKLDETLDTVYADAIVRVEED